MLDTEVMDVLSKVGLRDGTDYTINPIDRPLDGGPGDWCIIEPEGSTREQKLNTLRRMQDAMQAAGFTVRAEEDPGVEFLSVRRSD
jgi:hypothetical protein